MLLLVEVQVESVKEQLDAPARDWLVRMNATTAAEQLDGPKRDWRLLNTLSPEAQARRRRAQDAEVVLTEAMAKSIDRE